MLNKIKIIVLGLCSLFLICYPIILKINHNGYNNKFHVKHKFTFEVVDGKIDTVTSRGQIHYYYNLILKEKETNKIINLSVTPSDYIKYENKHGTNIEYTLKYGTIYKNDRFDIAYCLYVIIGSLYGILFIMYPLFDKVDIIFNKKHICTWVHFAIMFMIFITCLFTI